MSIFQQNIIDRVGTCFSQCRVVDTDGKQKYYWIYSLTVHMGSDVRLFVGDSKYATFRPKMAARKAAEMKLNRWLMNRGCLPSQSFKEEEETDTPTHNARPWSKSEPGNSFTERNRKAEPPVWGRPEKKSSSNVTFELPKRSSSMWESIPERDSASRSSLSERWSHLEKEIPRKPSQSERWCRMEKEGLTRSAQSEQWDRSTPMTEKEYAPLNMMQESQESRNREKYDCAYRSTAARASRNPPPPSSRNSQSTQHNPQSHLSLAKLLEKPQTVDDDERLFNRRDRFGIIKRGARQPKLNLSLADIMEKMGILDDTNNIVPDVDYDDEDEYGRPVNHPPRTPAQEKLLHAMLDYQLAEYFNGRE